MNQRLGFIACCVLASIATVATIAVNRDVAAAPVATGADAPGPSPTWTPEPSPTPTIQPGTCRPFGSKTASEAAYLGETIGITLTINGICAPRRHFTYFVFVMDASAAMHGQPSLQMRQAAAELVEGLALASFPNTRVGIVEFGDEARSLCRLMNDEARLLNCIRRVGAEGTTSIEAGLDEALRVIQSGRRALGPGEDATTVVVLFSGGHNAAGCEEAERASRRLRGAGVLNIAVCAGRDCDERCMRGLASSPRYYLRTENAGDLHAVFDQWRFHHTNNYLRRVTVTDRLPPNMRLVPGSAKPEPTLISPTGDALTWSDVYIPKNGVTYTFKVEPRELGHHATNLEAHADLEAATGWTGTFVFPVPTTWVRVPPTPTTRYVVDPTPTRAPTITPMPLPPWTATPERLSRQVWLPHVWLQTRGSG